MAERVGKWVGEVERGGRSGVVASVSGIRCLTGSCAPPPSVGALRVRGAKMSGYGRRADSAKCLARGPSAAMRRVSLRRAQTLWITRKTRPKMKTSLRDGEDENAMPLVRRDLDTPLFPLSLRPRDRRPARIAACLAVRRTPGRRAAATSGAALPSAPVGAAATAPPHRTQLRTRSSMAARRKRHPPTAVEGPAAQSDARGRWGGQNEHGDRGWD